MKTIIKNAKIWTADSGRRWADSVVIENGKFVAVGNGLEAAVLKSDSTDSTDYSSPSESTGDGIAPDEDIEIFDMGGKIILPSFIDPHTHVTCVARSQWIHLMPSYDSFDEVLKDIRDYAEVNPKEKVPYIYATSCPGTWLVGKTCHDLDKVVSDRPLLLCDSGYHKCLINSKMLELLEINKDTPYDNENVRNYERDENGVPTGIVFEHAYEEQIERMYEKIGWVPPAEDDISVIAPYIKQLNAWGITTVQDGFTESEKAVSAFKSLDDKGKLHLNYCANTPFFHVEDFDDAIKACHEWKEKYGSKHIYSDTVKFFLDGTNEIGTAASLDPFRNDPDGKNYGILNMQEDMLYEDLLKLNDEGLNIQIHLVGDRAFHVAVNAFERAKRTCASKKKDFNVRMNLLHCECTLPEDRKRAADLGIMINVTPHWNGGVFGPGALTYYSDEKFKNFYSFNDFFYYGANISVSSDTVDKEDMPRANPFEGIQIGMTRHDDVVDYSAFPLGTETDETGHTIRSPKKERMSLENLLYGYTINAAKAVGLSEKTGSISFGKDASFVVLDRNIFETDPYEIRDIKVLETWFEGEKIYSA